MFDDLDILWFADYIWAEEQFLWGLLVIPLLVAVYVLREVKLPGSIKLPTMREVPANSGGWIVWIRHVFFGLQMIGLAALIAGMARPQDPDDIKEYRNKFTEGINIMLAVDISGSMLAEDFKPNRLEASKEIAKDFFDSRPNDNIGLVVYGGYAFTQCPLTTDHDVLKERFDVVSTDMVPSSTAIGDGLMTAVNRLDATEAKSKVIILLSDGENNDGEYNPMDAAEVAKLVGVRVYTIGVGTEGKAPVPTYNMFGQKRMQLMPVKIDEETLQAIANETGGEYFRATDNAALATIYDQIDELEKSRTKVTTLKVDPPELFREFFWIGIILLLGEWFLRRTLMKELA